MEWNETQTWFYQCVLTTAFFCQLSAYFAVQRWQNLLSKIWSEEKRNDKIYHNNYRTIDSTYQRLTLCCKNSTVPYLACRYTLLTASRDASVLGVADCMQSGYVHRQRGHKTLTTLGKSFLQRLLEKTYNLYRGLINIVEFSYSFLLPSSTTKAASRGPSLAWRSGNTSTNG